MEEICSLKVRLASRVFGNTKELDIIRQNKRGTRDINTGDAVQRRIGWDGPKRIASSRFIASQLCEN